ncbi:hypothetical protein JOC77_003783 [Peribacillus deserti]|uniref:YopX protein domain-containing protein n=1 Tax=Peribacillus deserti TaxID=673318 RepID=A0ABS2QMB8_9BACI|nr:hypothetical protein [Peribacillus deserti]
MRTSEARLKDDYTIWNDTEKFQGEAFRIYSKSNYFDFIEKESNLNKFMPGESFSHYSIACIEHKVDIISNKEQLLQN